MRAQQNIFTRSPLILSADYWNKNFTPYIDPPNLDVQNDESLENNIQKFKQDINFAFHIKCEGFVIIRLHNQNPEKLGALVKEAMDRHFNFYGTVLIEVEMFNPREMCSMHCEDIKSDEDEETKGSEEQWMLWSRFHAATGYSQRIQVRIDFFLDLFLIGFFFLIFPVVTGDGSKFTNR